MDLEKAISALEKQLSGATDDDETMKKEMRAAMVKQAAADMSPEEKKEARKALMDGDDDDDDGKTKSAMEKEEEEKKAKAAQDKAEEEKKKEGKTGMDDDKDKQLSKDAMEMKEEMKKAMDDKDEKIASLTASVSNLVAQPLVTKMLKARQERGMGEKELRLFQKSLYGKSIDEIKQRYAEDMALMQTNPLEASVTPELEFAPFNGYEGALGATDGDKSLEELFP